MENVNENSQRVGVIGIGLMGHGIASNILKKGFALSFLDHPGNQPVDQLTAGGANLCSNVSDLTNNCDVIILCVTGTPQVEEILLGTDGVLSSLTEGTVIIDCSTAIPSSTLYISDAVAAAGGKFLDAPMTRTPKEAAEGRLNLIVGGEAELFKQQLSLLESFSENITYAGPVGSGHKLKLLHNFVSLGFSTVLAEAAACAEHNNVDPEVLVEVLSKGGGSGAILQRLMPYILNRDNSGFNFSISNAHKDIGYYLEMGKSVGATEKVASGVFNILDDALKSGMGGRSVPELITILNES